MTIERRHLAAEIRADVSGKRLLGYAATFNTETRIGDFFEVVKPGAFSRSLVNKDNVAALLDHNPERLLGRVRSGSLKLFEDARGLGFEVSVPDTSAGRDALELAQRGDCSGCSFGFRLGEGGDFWPDRRHRELRSVQLVEISIITGGEPAYPQTSVSARSRFTHVSNTLTHAQRRRYLASL
jgi:uncharacterized protein